MPKIKSAIYQVAFLSVILASYWITRVKMQAKSVDDAYIFLRYAKNFAAGHGLVFNIGDRVEGYTSPLWMFLLAGVALLTSNLVVVAFFIGGLFGAITLVILFFWGQARLPVQRRYLTVVPCLFLATNPSFVSWTWSGMDTALFTCLFLLSFLVFVKQAANSKTLFLSGFVFLLAILTRLDMVAVLPVYLFFIYVLNRSQKQLLWRKYLSFIAPLSLLALHLLWRYFYYGAWLPNTYYAKVAIPRSVLLSHGLEYLVQFFLAYSLLLIIILLAPPLLGRFMGPIQPGWHFGLSIILIWLPYITYMGGDHFPMFRFFTPVIAICAALLVWLIRQIDQGLKRPEATMTVLTLAMIVLSLNAFAFKYVGGAAVAQEGWMADRWSEVGRWFKANTEPDTSIAVGVVGAIPYYADLKTYDTLGLTNREVGTQGQTHLAGRPGHQKYNTAYLLAEKPDYIIFGISGLLPEPVGIDSISQDYDYAVYDFAHHDATAALYEYQVIELDSGYYIEVLALKEN